ncbi:MAG: hypothetical protein U5K00_22800 [Melioribacteraceae bacterium]|nr:hypothetical protein [Melioribacteraceae bacterium]
MSKDSRKEILTVDEERTNKKAYRKLGQTNIDEEKPFELFKEWQSRKTRSIKRFVLSLSFLLTFAWIVNINIYEIQPLGLNVSEVNEKRFLGFLLVIHVVTFIYYRVQRSIDLNIKKARISLFEEDLNELINHSDFFENLISKGKGKTFVNS